VLAEVDGYGYGYAGRQAAPPLVGVAGVLGRRDCVGVLVNVLAAGPSLVARCISA
jgi:hypothetical protein